MRGRLFFIPLAALACGGNPENNAACGLTSIAAASMVVQSLQNLNQVVNTPPAHIPDLLPAKVVGRGTARARAGHGSGGLDLAYEGEGFPKVPGFGLLLIDDSLEVVRGVLIFEPDPPKGYPSLGSIAAGSTTLPLYGLRVHWPSLNARRCPMFQPVADSVARR
jgi:hypothetical protein